MFAADRLVLLVRVISSILSGGQSRGDNGVIAQLNRGWSTSEMKGAEHFSRLLNGDTARMPRITQQL